MAYRPKLNYQFKKHDARDYVFEPNPRFMGRMKVKKYKIPTFRVYDQGSIGSCVSNAIALCIHTKTKRELSRLCHYFTARVSVGDRPTDDNGLEIRSAAGVLKSFGIPPEKTWPYDVEKFSRFPSLDTYKQAAVLPKMTYRFVDQTLNAIRAAINQNNPIIFGVMVYDSFMTKEVTETGVVPMPDTAKEEWLGGHCILAVGYNDDTQRLVFQNSWGSDWGKNGQGTLPYEYLLNSDLAGDFVTLHF